jgi:hypothetical protein
MADQRGFVRVAVAVSSLVVAVCAVVVTVKVASSGGISVRPERVLDATALEKQVADEATSLTGSAGQVECPLSVVVAVNTTFQCRYSDRDNNPHWATVTIVDDQGKLEIEMDH